MRRAYLSRTPEATEALGRRLGERLPAGAVVALVGDLGSGKTTLTRGLARGLEVSGPVTSPTFVLMQEHAGRRTLYHFDAWMSGRESTFLLGGGAEYLGGDGVCVVEWADRIEPFLPRPRLVVELEHRSRTERGLLLRLLGAEEPCGERERRLADALEAVLRALPGRIGAEVAGVDGDPGAVEIPVPAHEPEHDTGVGRDA